MKFRVLPSVMALISGLFICIMTLLYRYSIEESLWIVAIVMLVTFVFGLFIRMILNKTIVNEEVAPTEKNENSDMSNQDIEQVKADS